MPDEQTVFKCPRCQAETPLEKAQRPEGRKMFFQCGKCGYKISDRHYSIPPEA